MRKFTLLKNVIIITITSFILRAFGMIVRLYISKRIGAEGMGLYQLIISIYVLATTFATAGIKTAIIRLLTSAIARRENSGNIRKIVIKATIISLLIAFLTMIAFYLLAEPISIYWLKDERCILSIKIFIWVLPFLVVEAACKGYFLARRRVIFNSLAQLFEQTIRIIFLFLFLELCKTSSLEIMCMLIILSDMVSEAAACLFVYAKYRKETKKFNYKGEKGFGIGKFFEISFPVAIDNYMRSILKTAENILIPSRLAMFTLSKEMSLSQVRIFKRNGIATYIFPSIIFVSNFNIIASRSI